jgi:hypothetical protein
MGHLMSGFDPYPPEPNTPTQDWGEPELIEITRSQGYNYFVLFNNPRMGYNRVREIERRDAARAWMEEHRIEFSWVGGRSAYEFAFKTEEEAVLFKMAWGC